MADDAIAVPSQASFGGQQPQKRSGPVSFASVMITHCQIMGQEPRIALPTRGSPYSWPVPTSCSRAHWRLPHPLTTEWLGGRNRERPCPFTGPGSCSTTARLAPLRRR